MRSFRRSNLVRDAMRYLMLIYSDENSTEHATKDEIDRISRAHVEVMQDAGRRGVLLGVDKLKPTMTATTVRMDSSDAMITDGPFAETKEQLAGYYMFECADLDEAIEWAKRIPTGCRGGEGCIEIRPVQEIRKPDSLGR
jgi:hypothetical protein